ncbi:MAG TPA: DNA topoisomerase I [Candidatus Aquicultor sp.]|jgi:DNA topoisomerase-1
MKLIVTEKNIAAERIAKILANGKIKTEKSYTIPIYRYAENGSETAVIGLKGHILKVDFPEEYSSWQKVTPDSLIDAAIIKVPMQKQIIKAMQKLAKDANEVVIATDFDREGELIGVDAANLIREVNPKVGVKRSRFSAITKQEIERAFTHPEDLYINLAQAGEARQDIDLIWGATLTRFISLASRRLGGQFLSVGRVQSPTLALIAQREKEREAFVKQPYWQIRAMFDHSGTRFIASHKTEKFWDHNEALQAIATINGTKTGTVTSVTKSQRETAPPAPFNTTAFLSAAASTGLSTANAMRIAESLYMRGLISYPRVDNTVYPPSLDLKDILKTLSASSQFGFLARELLMQKELKPTRGKKFATDHPPIHPTGVVEKGNLDPQEWKVYELVVRRFMATLAPVSISESMRIDIDTNGEPFFARGSHVVVEGWLRYYPYSRKKDEELPPAHEGDILDLINIEMEDKEMQPPARYSQSKLIQVMEELGLGTKATRHEIIKGLYDRGYIHGDPIIPTETGVAVADSLVKYAQLIATPAMTAELEKDMDAIAEGETNQHAVVDRSRLLLHEIMKGLEEHKEELGAEIRAGIREDRIVGDCTREGCGGQLRIMKSKKTRKRFVGCTNYKKAEEGEEPAPDSCTVSYPLPQRGEIIPLMEICEECGSPKIKVMTGIGRPWILCIDPNCPSKIRKAAEKAAREAAKGTAADGGTALKVAKPKRVIKKKTTKKAAAKKSTIKKATVTKVTAKKTATRKTSVAAPKRAAAGE